MVQLKDHGFGALAGRTGLWTHVLSSMGNFRARGSQTQEMEAA